MPTAQHSLQFLDELQKKEHDIVNDSLVTVLLTDSLSAFDPATHSTYGDISGHELAEGNGYSQKSKTLTSVATSIDTSNSRVIVSCTNPSWEVSGESWTNIKHAAVINTTHLNETLVTCITFDTVYTLEAGVPFQVDFESVGGIYAANAVVGSSYEERK